MLVHYIVLGVDDIEIWPVDEVKNYLRISHDYDDKLIANLIDTAIDSAESFTGLSLRTRSIICRINNVSNLIYLKHLPILEIEEVLLLEKEEKIHITSEFEHAQEGAARLGIPDKYIRKNLEIRYKTGYSDVIPRSIRQAMLMHVAAMYENTEDSEVLSNQIKDLYAPYRAIKI